MRSTDRDLTVDERKAAVAGALMAVHRGLRPNFHPQMDNIAIMVAEYGVNKHAPNPADQFDYRDWTVREVTAMVVDYLYDDYRGTANFTFRERVEYLRQLASRQESA